MSPIFYIATVMWAVFMVFSVVQLCRYEDRRAAERIEANRKLFKESVRRYVEQMAELRTIDNLTALEAFRIKEGLWTQPHARR